MSYEQELKQAQEKEAQGLRNEADGEAAQAAQDFKFAARHYKDAVDWLDARIENRKDKLDKARAKYLKADSTDADKEAYESALRSLARAYGAQGTDLESQARMRAKEKPKTAADIKQLASDLAELKKRAKEDFVEAAKLYEKAGDLNLDETKSDEAINDYALAAIMYAQAGEAKKRKEMDDKVQELKQAHKKK